MKRIKSIIREKVSHLLRRSLQVSTMMSSQLWQQLEEKIDVLVTKNERSMCKPAYTQ